MQAFDRAGLTGWKLVFVGAADHPDEYQQRLIDEAQRCAVVMTGFQTGLALGELYAHAGAFVLPSSHEGLPIALLEALSYGLDVIASDIPANVEVGLPAEQYFPLGDVEALASRLRAAAARSADPDAIAQRRQWVAEHYDWHAIARATMEVYRGVVSKSAR